MASIARLSRLLLKQFTTPGAPGAGQNWLYPKLDDELYTMGNDGVERGINAPHPVRMSTTGSVTLSGLQTIDGVVGAANDRVIVRHQGVFAGNSFDNGVWLMQSGAWTRAPDANTSAKLAGTSFVVSEGTWNRGHIFKCTFDTTDTLGTTGLAFLNIGGADFGGIFASPFMNSRSGGATFADSNTRFLRTWMGSAWYAVKGIQDYSATAPSFPQPGELWYDSANNQLKVYNGTAFIACGISDAMPIGTVFAFAGVSAPTGCLIADGTSQLRASYPDLLTATTFTALGSGAASQAVVTTSDTSNMRLGMRVEHPNITGGAATILVINPNVSITLSANLSTLTTSLPFTFFPHGAVDATHFNLPLATGKTIVGKDGTTEFATVGLTGGDKNMQQHGHALAQAMHLSAAEASGFGLAASSSFTNRVIVGGAPANTEPALAGTGNSQNLQPYNTLLYVVKATAATVNLVIPYQVAAPSNPLAGQKWYDTTYGIEKLWTGAAWIATGFGPTLKKRVNVTANSAAFSAETVMASLPATTFDGVTEIELEFSWYNFSHTVTTDTVQCYLYDGPTAGSGTILQVWLQSFAANGGSGRMVWRGVPSAGSHTFTARAARTAGTGTATMVAVATDPAQLSMSPIA